MTPAVTTADVALPERALSKATSRAADRLGINSRTLAGIIGLSEASVSRMRKGDYVLEKGSKPFELSVLFIRLFRSLDAITGGDENVAKAWLRNQNTALRNAPVEMIQSVAGLVNVINYLDARRAPL